MKVWETIESFFLGLARKLKLGFLADIYEDHLEGMRYLVFGVISTIVNIVVAAFTYYILFASLPEEIKVNLSTIIAIIAAWICAYVTNKTCVFKSKTNSIKELMKEITSFIGCRLITAVLEIILMNVFVTKLGFNYLLMKIVSNVIVIILNFVFSKLIIFKDNKKEVEEK